MKITKKDGQSAIMWGTVGLLGGIGYALAVVGARNTGNIQDLSPATDALYKHCELFSLFCQLQKFRALSEDDFCLAVDSADRLVFRLSQLQDKATDASLSDRPEGRTNRKMCLKHVEELVLAAKKHTDARVYVEVHLLYTKIFDVIQSIWMSLYRLTDDIAFSV